MAVERRLLIAVGRGVVEGFRRVPRLTREQCVVMDAVILADCLPLSGIRFRRLDGGVFVWDEMQRRVMKRLITEGLVEVMRLQPAAYRVTALGRLARGLR